MPAVLGLLALLAFLSFGRPVLQAFPPVFEDHAALTGIPAVRDGHALQALAGAARGAAAPGDHTGTYRPLTVFSLALNRALAGSSPRGFHLVNLLLHLLASFLLFLLLRALLEDPVAALLGAALFACHPMSAGTVSWISGRAELLLLCFALGALLAHRRHGGAGATAVVLAPLLALAAMLSHEAGLALVAIFPLVDAAAVRKPGRRAAGPPRYAGVVAAAIAYVLLRLHAHPYQAPLGLTPRLLLWLTTLKLWTLSVLLGALPILSPLISPPRLGSPLGSELLSRAQDPTATVGLLVLLGLVVAGLWQLRRNPPVGAGVLWFVLAFVPLLSPTLALHASMDRLLYFPLAGLALALAAILALSWRRNAALQRPIQAAAVVVGIVFLTLAGSRAGLWQDESEYLRQVAARNPGDARALNDLGGAYLGLNQPAAALEVLRRAHALAPDDIATVKNLSQAYLATNHPDSATAVLGPLADANPERPDMQAAMGDAMNASGRHVEAMKMYSQALGQDSTRLQNYVGMAQALAGQGKFAEAASLLHIAARLNPRDPAVPNDLGLVLEELRRFDSADSAFQAAIRMSPKMVQFHFNRARLLYLRADYNGANQEVDQLVALLPGDPGPLKLREQVRAKMARSQSP